MRSNPRNKNGVVTGVDPSPTDIFRSLSDAHRQYVMEYLVLRPGAVAVGDLADYIAIKEGKLTPEGTERALSRLHHVHLPRLSAAGLVSHDPVRETVELRIDADDVRPFLQLTLATLR